MGETALSSFHPLLREWFLRRFGGPTDIQERAWPAIAAGQNVLITAPTGTGKTYAAFFHALNELVTGKWEGGGTRVLYVSPLKALNNDIRENLLNPLAEIGTFFAERGAELPHIEVLTRSGDTPSPERQRMARHPPEILITTPESLNLILASPRSRGILAGVRAVILDEIHAIVGSKRGTHLITAVDRMVPIAGEFQRIGLSATVKPVEETAAFLGGFSARNAGGSWVYEQRPVAVIRSAVPKEVSISIRYFGRDEEAQPGDTYWQLLCGQIKEIVRARRATLIFVNSRQLAERITHLINEGEEQLLAYAHHGSLSKELRAVVEKRLKAGELQAIVATSSLELGIDIGELDEVLLVETPMSVSQTIQRLGRSGHAVGLTSRGTLFPSNGMDLIRGAVISRLVRSQEIEEVHPILCPLDILAQIIIAMVGVEQWRLNDLYGVICSSYPYHTLSRTAFDGVIEMLEGKYADSRVRELRARISVDRVTGHVRGKEGVLYLLYSSGGTIPDRGYFGLHVQGTDAKIGELDEEFVWERKVGDSFTLGTQRWKIAGIDHQKVKVVPWSGAVNAAPFWRAESLYRDYHLSERIGLAMAAWDERAGKAGFVGEVARDYDMDEPTAARLEDFLLKQREATHAGLPHRYRLLIEHTGSKAGLHQAIIHNLWGGRVNVPLSLALSALLRREYHELDVLADNDGLVIVLPETPDEDFEIPALLMRLASADVVELIQEKLESSGFFGARFRESAGRALLLPRASLKRRMPLWVTRLRAKKLFDRVRHYRDFPIIAEAWRTCIRDEFDLDSLQALLGEVRSGAIAIEETHTAAPSPFCSRLAWLNTGQYMYADDAPGGTDNGQRSLSSELLKEMVFSESLRIKIAPAVLRRFVEKLQRTSSGYAPRSARELIDWSKERLAIPLEEWEALLAAMERDHGLDAESVREEASTRVELLEVKGSGETVAQVMVPTEQLPRLKKAFEGDQELLEAVLTQWLQFYGAVPLSTLRALFGRDPGALDTLIDSLVEDRTIIRDILTEGGSEIEICDAENFEHLLGFLRREAMPSFTALPPEQLGLFLACRQGLAERASNEEALRESVESLFGYPSLAGNWESEILPARLKGYRRQWLDRLLAESDLEWFGCGDKRIAFRLAGDAALYPGAAERADHAAAPPGADAARSGVAAIASFFADPRARYSFWDLHERSSISTERFSESVWHEVWQGRLLCDSFEVVRRGLASDFTPEPVGPERRPLSRRGSFNRWKTSRPTVGTWYLPERSDEGDLIDAEEQAKERVRQLLDRYGILFRELLKHELPAFRWGSLFRSLRIMELAGEVLSGSFFEGIPGLQFISHSAFRALQEGLPEDAVYWMNAADPASLCGIELPGRRGLPSRLPSNHVVFRGGLPVLVSRRSGMELDIRVPPEDAMLPRYLSLFPESLARDYEPPKSIKVEMINGIVVRESPYRQVLVDLGFKEDFKVYTLWGR